MAQATTLSFSKVRIKLGNGASPEVFTAPCGLNTRGLNRTKNANEIDIPDCDDEDAPAWVGREIRSLDWTISGEGVIAAESFQMWEDFFEGQDSKSVMIEFEFPDSPPGLIQYTGKAHLTSYNMTANRGEKGAVTVELSGDGAIVQIAPV